LCTQTPLNPASDGSSAVTLTGQCNINIQHADIIACTTSTIESCGVLSTNGQILLDRVPINLTDGKLATWSITGHKITINVTGSKVKIHGDVELNDGSVILTFVGAVKITINGPAILEMKEHLQTASTISAFNKTQINNTTPTINPTTNTNTTRKTFLKNGKLFF